MRRTSLQLAGALPLLLCLGLAEKVDLVSFDKAVALSARSSLPGKLHELVPPSFTQLKQTSDHQKPKLLQASNTNVHLQEHKNPLTHSHLNKSQDQSNKVLEKICIGTSNRMSSQNNKTDHYQNLAERYRNCTYVMGNLEITWLDKNQSYDLSFLESIREITGYLLIAYVEIDTIRMPNLQIIRGRDLFKLNSDQKEEFALFLIDNDLKQLELPNLREILAGSVGSYNNQNLCHIGTIDWGEILNWPMYKSVFVYNGTQPECPPCHDSCHSNCWGQGSDLCQKFSKNICSPQCGGRCFGSEPRECCHASCAGGCHGPSEKQCFACKNLSDEGVCVQECPSLRAYNTVKFLWEENPSGKYAFGAQCVKKCPEHFFRDSGACVRVCPPNKRSVNGECEPCVGPCPKNCHGVEVVHSGNIDQLINCTIIEGSLTISNESFTGFYSHSANGMRIKPMHPSRLEIFKTLREITGYLNIQAYHPDFKNLTYFKNLRKIGTSETTDMIYALSIVKTSLVSLNLRSLRTVHTGKILIEDNKDLCFADTIDWRQIDVKDGRVTTRNNAETSRCLQLGLQCHKQCAQDGCWGLGPDECLSCENYKLDDYCVDDCDLLPPPLSDVLAYKSDKELNMCKRCHPECKFGCFGQEAKHCHQCKNVKDGPYCVAECPSHKYNNNGRCEECDKSCQGGCTGPSNKLGDGGCNSCGMAIINSTDPLVIHCQKAEDCCPEGYYQEYISPSQAAQDGPLKFSSGKPICRKCHHRCKNCTGMGTHVSVCECAKYMAGEQCEDFCPRDYYPDETSRQCLKCSAECNGCYGPTEADCHTCRVYRIYDESSFSQSGLSADHLALSVDKQQTKFNCTAHCPPDKPHRISGSDMLDPYCSEDPGIDIESPRIVSLIGLSTSIFFIFTFSSALIICSYIYRCQIQKDKTVKLTMHLSGIDDVEPLTPSNLKPNLAPLRSIKETELRTGNILGSGFGGTVYQGFWFPEGQEHKEPKVVAIKVLRDNGQANINKEFLDEAYIMASVNHPNLVRLLAVCMTPKHLMLVTQLMPLGCLLEYVKKYKNDIGSKNLLEWCKQIARGMAYLEEHRMVHRDLALRNVLLQTSGRAMISDFGLAKLLDLDESEYHSGGGRLPIKWLAPECIRERKFTHKSDVWAFGVTVWELLTFGQRPFHEYETRDVPMAIEKGARLQQPAHMSAEVYKVMYSCWFYNPDDRPHFAGLEKNFVKFARDPERYLICRTKGIDYQAERKLHEKNCRSHSPGQDNCDEYSDSNNETEEEPMSAGADLTPSTNNRINETKFEFELSRQHAQNSPDPDNTLPIQPLKKLTVCHRHHNQVHQGDVVDSLISSHHHLHQLHQQHKEGKHQMMTSADLNNNSTLVPVGRLRPTNGSCWSMHQTISTNSLGQKSEQPTDVYDYLLPSPCTDALAEGRFSNYYSSSYDPKSNPISPTTPASIRQPPHSAGLIGVNNEEYFLTRVNYVNQQQQQQANFESHDDSSLGVASASSSSTSGNHHFEAHQLGRQLSTSNGDIPHSLV